jgi:hypothetical protein
MLVFFLPMIIFAAMLEEQRKDSITVPVPVQRPRL